MSNKMNVRDVSDKEAQVTKAFQKKAMVFGTEEFKLWREYKRLYPEAVMTTKSIRRNPDKETYKNLTYENILLFLKEQEKSEKLIAEFERQKQLSKVQTSPYRAVLAWFLKAFPKYDEYKEFFEERAKKEAPAAIIEVPKAVND